MVKNVYIDIETFGGTKPTIQYLKVPGSMSKPETIERWLNDPANLDEAWRKQALDVLKGQIVCIGLAFDQEMPLSIYGMDEKDLMVRFFSTIWDLPPQELASANWIAHNGHGFDFPYLWHRLNKYGLHDVFPNPKSSQMIDTMKLAGFTDYKAMYSLDNLCRFYGIEGKGDVSGKDVHDLVVAGKLDEIGVYCCNDVRMLRDLYGKLK